MSPRREDPAVAAATERMVLVGEYIKGRLLPEQVAAIQDLELPYEATLDEDERRGH